MFKGSEGPKHRILQVCKRKVWTANLFNSGAVSQETFKIHTTLNDSWKSSFSVDTLIFQCHQKDEKYRYLLVLWVILEIYRLNIDLCNVPL